MIEIIRAMQANGLNPGDTLVLDGKPQRFKVDAKDAKASGWYVGYQNFTRRGGQPFYVALYGSWRTDDVFKYQSDAEYTHEDRRAIKEQIAKAQKEAEEARRAEQDRTALECLQFWDRLEENQVSDYLTGKLIAHSFGARSQVGNFGVRNLYIPLRDVDGKLWSLQKIQPEGGKFFHPGGRVQGCFHVIGGSLDQEDTIYIAEGFATAISIHMAIGRPVVVAFNASNLLPVGEALRKHYKDKSFVVCGDEDLWSRRGDGTVFNPGREKAEETAKKLMGVSIFPRFRLLEEGRTTDFNDLHVREGIEAVKDQIASAKPEKHYIIALGYNAGNYYLLSNVNPQIQCLSGASLATAGALCRLQPLLYWETLHPATNGGVKWQDAADQIMQECHKRGIFRPDKVRGRGVWLDSDKVVYHMGDRLWYEGAEHPLHRNGLGSNFIYEKDDAMPPIHSRPLEAGECVDLLDACSLIRWKRGESFMFFAGWLVLAPVCGALHWRPHVWLTGPSGTGKSYLMQSLIHPLLSSFVHYFQGQTTEAGIRQTTGSSTKPVIFDEFETNDDRSSDRVRAVLELARQASSESDAIVAKGTASGEAMQFKPRFSMLVSSVRVNLVHEEDRNRFTIIDLMRQDRDRLQHFERLSAFVHKLTPEYGHRLFARTLSHMDVLLKNCQVFQRVLGERFNMRLGQQYGALLGGYYLLTSDEPATVERARLVVNGIDFSVSKEASEEQDEMDCLNHLLEKVVTPDSDGIKIERSIIELVREHLSDRTRHIRALQRRGIAVDGEYLVIASKNVELMQVYNRSKWAGNYSKALSRIEGAVNNKIKRIEGRPIKCVWIPLSIVFSK